MLKNGDLKKPHNKLIGLIGSRYFYTFILIWFIVQASLIALLTKFGLPPDENFHFNFIKLYAENGPTPFLNDQEGYYWLGDVTRRPSVLYHYAMSWPYRLMDGLPATYIYLRFINIGFAVGTLMLVKKLAKQLKLSDFVANLSLFMLVNTLMFTFLSAAISYDNPLIMLSILSLVLMVALMQRLRAITLIYLTLVMIVASVVKFTFLPLAVLIVIALTFYYRKGINGTIKSIFKDARTNISKGKLFVLVPLLLISFAFALERYGINIVSYGSIRADCVEVHNVQDCRKRPLFQRREKVEALDKEPTIPPTRFSVKWVDTAKERIYGIHAHKFFKPMTVVVYGTWSIVGLMALAFIRKFRWRNRKLDYLIAISFTYVLIAATKNFMGYQDSGIFGMGLQGRYIFPVFPVLYLIGNYYVEKWLEKRYILLSVYALLAIGVFVIAGLPSYFYLTDLGWFSKTFHPLLDNFITQESS